MTEEKGRPQRRMQTGKSTPVKGARRKSRASSRRQDSQLSRHGKRRQQQQPSGLSITVQIPAMRRPRLAPDGKKSILGRILARRKLVAAAALLLCVAAILGTHTTPNSKTASTSAIDKTQPDFQVLRPSAETASVLKYDGKRDLAIYTTTFSGARLTVSQQKLPPTFSKDPSAILRLSDSIHAKQRLDTVKGPVYIASNDKGSDQLAVFASPKVLLMIHTDRTLDDASWKSFVELLAEK